MIEKFIEVVCLLHQWSEGGIRSIKVSAQIYDRLKYVQFDSRSNIFTVRVLSESECEIRICGIFIEKGDN